MYSAIWPKRSDLYVMKADGSQKRRLTTGENATAGHGGPRTAERSLSTGTREQVLTSTSSMQTALDSDASPTAATSTEAQAGRRTAD